MGSGIGKVDRVKVGILANEVKIRPKLGQNGRQFRYNLQVLATITLIPFLTTVERNPEPTPAP